MKKSLPSVEQLSPEKQLTEALGTLWLFIVQWERCPECSRGFSDPGMPCPNPSCFAHPPDSAGQALAWGSQSLSRSNGAQRETYTFYFWRPADVSQAEA